MCVGLKTERIPAPGGAAGGSVGERVSMNGEVEERRKAERVAELEAELAWHRAEVEYAHATIAHHERNISDIEAQLGQLKPAGT